MVLLRSIKNFDNKKMSQSFIELLSSKPVVNAPKEIEVKIAPKEPAAKEPAAKEPDVEVVPSATTEAEPKELSLIHI